MSPDEDAMSAMRIADSSQCGPPITRLPRRTVLKWFAAIAASSSLPGFDAGSEAVAAEAPSLSAKAPSLSAKAPSLSAKAPSLSAKAPSPSPKAPSPSPKAPAAKGYGTDPLLAKFYAPGDFWPLTLSPDERKTATALADLILPADHLGPAASEVRTPDYIDEWISAPYPAQQKDRGLILPGLAWLEVESRKRFGKDFAALDGGQKCAIADDICWPADAGPRFKKAAFFFVRFRALAASAYYGTEAGWKAIGYVGNVPLARFDGPPKEVLERLGVEQTVP